MPGKEQMMPFPAKILQKIQETPDTYTLVLEPLDSRKFLFKPGQFTMIYDFGVGEIPISISGDPMDTSKIVQTIRATGTVSGHIVSLPEGEIVGLRGPFGKPWPIKEAEGHDILIVAGGIGLAPLRPTIYHVLSHRALYGKLFVLYGARTPKDLLYKDEIEVWQKEGDGFAFLVTVDRGDETWKGNVGLVTELFKYIDLDPKNTVAMICGPRIMMKVVATKLEEMGLDPSRIFVSMELNMKCGMRICGRCQLGPYFVCKDGPVFPFSMVKTFFEVRGF